jgi:hypothetical protein
MRTHGVVVVLPRGDDTSGIVQNRESVLVQAFGAHLVVKAHGARVLDGLPRPSEREVHLPRMRPGVACASRARD